MPWTFHTLRTNSEHSLLQSASTTGLQAWINLYKTLNLETISEKVMPGQDPSILATWNCEMFRSNTVNFLFNQWSKGSTFQESTGSQLMESASNFAPPIIPVLILSQSYHRSLQLCVACLSHYWLLINNFHASHMLQGQLQHWQHYTHFKLLFWNKHITLIVTSQCTAETVVMCKNTVLGFVHGLNYKIITFQKLDSAFIIR